MKTNTAFLSLFFVAISTFFAAQARAQMPPDVSFLNYGGLQGAMLPPYGGVQSQLQLSMQGQYAMPGFDQPSVPQILGGSNFNNFEIKVCRRPSIGEVNKCPRLTTWVPSADFNEMTPVLINFALTQPMQHKN
jgi:hypothetical protein